MGDSSAEKLAMSTGLSVTTCMNLLERGWVYVQNEGEPPMWVSPSAGLPAPILHSEPRCNRECMNMAPHRHGFSCARSCVCEGICHPDCPAHKKEE